MGPELKSLFQVDTRKLIPLIGITFVMIITFQYLELPYENVLSRLLPSKSSVDGQSSALASSPSSSESGVLHNFTNSIGLEYNGGTYTGNETAQDNKFFEGKGTNLNNDVIPEIVVGLNKSSTIDEGRESPKESSTDEFTELNKNSTVDYTESSQNKTTADEAGGLSRESEKEVNMKSLNSLNQSGADSERVNDFGTSEGNNKDQNEDVISEGEVGLNRSSILDKDSTSSVESSTEEFEDLNKNSTVDYAESSDNMTVAEEASKTEESFSSKNDTVDIYTSNNNIGNKNINTLSPVSTLSSDTGLGSPLPTSLPINVSINSTLGKDIEANVRTPTVSTNSSISSLEQHETPSFDKNQISKEIQNNFTSSGDNTSPSNTPEMKKNPEVPPALTTIADMNNLFYQSRVSYHSMTPRWSSEADEVLLNARSQIENAPTVKNDQKLYAPLYRNFSMFKSLKNLIEYLKNYVGMIAAKYSFWNRTEGADHFLVACHDWAPRETKELMANCIKALCNSDIREGYTFGKDVSLPEAMVRNPKKPLKDLGGYPLSKRSILAFFAGKMHGYVRPILIEQWGNKDPDMIISGKIPKGKGKMSYIQYMKNSKYCICLKGYEVNSPRVVEAILFECVPVINWESFAVFILEKDIPSLKKILLSIPEKRYRQMQLRVRKIQQHFMWHTTPERYDIFHMILHSVWFNRVFQIKPS